VEEAEKFREPLFFSSRGLQKKLKIMRITNLF